MQKLKDKTVLITGASRGIGATTARLMAEHGATVFASDILEAEVQQAASEIAGNGGHASAIKLDVTKESDWYAAIDLISSTTSGLDILVNNAGILLAKDFEDVSISEWQTLVNVNMTSVFLGTKICAPALRESAKRNQHGSAIVNVSSIVGLVAAPNDQLYAMTKGGVTLFTKSTAVSFAMKGDRIRVNSVHPGVVNTRMGEQAIAAQAIRLGITDTEEIRKASAERHPMGEIADPIDIANSILFLASDDSRFMTGISLPVDGGYTAQ